MMARKKELPIGWLKWECPDKILFWRFMNPTYANLPSLARKNRFDEAYADAHPTEIISLTYPNAFINQNTIKTE